MLYCIRDYVSTSCSKTTEVSTFIYGIRGTTDPELEMTPVY